MALLGKAVLGVWNEVDPATEDDFNDWYLREHIPERTSVPGIMRGRRYRAISGSPKYMALYEAATLGVLTTGVYRAQLDNPTTWTQRVMPGFTFALRGICNVIATAGQGAGGFATVIHFRPASGQETTLRTWVEERVLALMDMTQVTAAHAWVGASGEPVSPTTELSLRAAPDRRVEWVLAIEAADPDALDAARDAAMAGLNVAHGAEDVRAYPSYQLLFVLERNEPVTV